MPCSVLQPTLLVTHASIRCDDFQWPASSLSLSVTQPLAYPIGIADMMLWNTLWRAPYSQPTPWCLTTSVLDVLCLVAHLLAYPFDI